MVIDIIRTKRAVRQFTDQPVPEEIVRAISVSCAAICPPAKRPSAAAEQIH